MATNAPCKDCEFRYPGCHGFCKVYKEWREPIDAMQRERDKRRDADNFLHEGHYNGWRIYKKRP